MMGVRRRRVLAWFPLGAALVCSGGVGAVRVEVLTPPRTVAPGDVALHVFAVRNDLSAQVSVSLTPDLPPGWSSLGIPALLLLGPGEEDVVFLAVVVPRGAEAGRYLVGLGALWDGGEAAAEGEVRVVGVAGVSLVLPSPGQGQPGATVSYTLEVVNRGNVLDRFSVDASSARGWPVRTSPRELLLRPLEAGRVEVVLAIPPEAPAGRELLTVEVRSAEGAEARAVWFTRVLPPGPGAIAGTTLSALAMKGVGTLGYDFISGQGGSELALRGEGEVLGGSLALALQLAGPWGPAPLRPTRGFLRYEGEWTWAEAGEAQLPATSLLSPLGAVGMGGGVRGDTGRVELLTGWAGGEGRFGAQGAWTPPWGELGLALRRVAGAEDVRAGAAWVQLRLAEGLSLGVEGALAGPLLDGGALFRGSAGTGPEAGLLLEAYAVGPGVPSPRADRMGFTLGGQLGARPLGLRFTARWERDNVAGVSVATLVRSELTTAVDWSPFSLFSLFGTVTLRRTSALGSPVGGRTTVFDLSAAVGDTPLVVRLGGRWRREEDLALSSWTTVAEYTQRLGLTLGRTKATLGLTQSVRTSGGGPPELAGGAELDLRAAGGLTLSARHTRSGGSLGVEVPFPLSSLSSLVLRLDLSWTGPGEVRSFRVGASFERRFSLTPPFLPARGWLEGRLFVDDDGDGQPDPGEAGVEGAVLSAGGIQVASGKDGRFLFPPLDPGRYVLAVDALPAGLRLRGDAPREVEVFLAGRTRLALPAERLGEITGIVVEDLDRSGGREEGERGLAGVRLVLEGEGADPLDTFTDGLGLFSWTGLPAGTYRVRVDPATLPRGAALVGPGEVVVNLGAGEVKEVAFAAGPPPVVVVYRPPVADFTWEPRPARAGQPVTFDARPSLGAIVRYRWEFTGDGIPDGEGAQAVWTFPEPRLYLVTLEVEDDEGGTDRVTLLVPVEP